MSELRQVDRVMLEALWGLIDVAHWHHDPLKTTQGLTDKLYEQKDVISALLTEQPENRRIPHYTEMRGILAPEPELCTHPDCDCVNAETECPKGLKTPATEPAEQPTIPDYCRNTHCIKPNCDCAPVEPDAPQEVEQSGPGLSDDSVKRISLAVRLQEAEKQRDELLGLIKWTLGESPDGLPDWPERLEGQGAFYWRIQLRELLRDYHIKAGKQIEPDAPQECECDCGVGKGASFHHGWCITLGLQQIQRGYRDTAEGYGRAVASLQKAELKRDAAEEKLARLEGLVGSAIKADFVSESAFRREFVKLRDYHTELAAERPNAYAEEVGGSE